MGIKKAAVVGSGPNGLMAAIILQQAGVSTTVFEAQPTIGGGLRSAELTLPGFVHDVCSAVYPMAIASPAFAALPLKDHGLEWIYPPAPLAHPMENGAYVLLEKSIEQTAANLGSDGAVYQRTLGYFAKNWPLLKEDILAPVHFPRHPLLAASFGWLALRPATWAGLIFKTLKARALFAGVAAHSILPLNTVSSSAVGWVLMAAAHTGGWPIPKGGSQKIADALASYLRSIGGEIVTGHPVQSVDEFNNSDAVLCDTSPRQLIKLAGHVLPKGYISKLESYKYGPGVYKMDWALSGPIPWRAPACLRAGTVHLGGTAEEIAVSESGLLEHAPTNGTDRKPFVLLAQPSLFDSTRAPKGQHTAWAYCHVPNGSTADMSWAIEDQIERYAPGFKARILARHTMTTTDLEVHNANLVGGDISGGLQSLTQLFLRPTRQLYRTPRKGLYLCSASTPPGGGVHGLCGYFAAKAALQDLNT